MTILSQVTNPPINWGFWIVYFRFQDGRLMFFRGKRRRQIYIKDLKCGKTGAWTWDQEYARLFQFEPKIELGQVAKSLDPKIRQEILDKTNYRGFHDMVLKTHLILPHRT